jgi:hypothetical protein
VREAFFYVKGALLLWRGHPLHSLTYSPPIPTTLSLGAPVLIIMAIISSKQRWVQRSTLEEEKRKNEGTREIWETHMEVKVFNNNIDNAFRALKKKLALDGFISDLKKHQYATSRTQ